MVTPEEVVVIVNAGCADGKPPWIVFELADMPSIPAPDEDGERGAHSARAFERGHSVACESHMAHVRRLKAHEPIAFALNGKAWNVLQEEFPYLVAPILMHAKIFGRMSPDQKAQLIEGYQELGFIVGMCGDGANDCGVSVVFCPFFFIPSFLLSLRFFFPSWILDKILHVVSFMGGS